MASETPEDEAETNEAKNRARIAQLERQKLEREEQERERQEILEAREEDKKRSGGGEKQQEPPASADQGRFINLVANLVVPKSKTAWILIIVLLLFLLIAWWKNFLGIRTVLLTFGVTISGIIAVAVILIFIGYGWATCKGDLAKFFIATALFIWILDLVPQDFFLIGPWLGPEWAGFIFPLEGIWQIPWASIFLSGFFFSLLYINMVFNIIEKEYISFGLGFIFILVTNYLITSLFPNYLSYYLPIPTLNGITFFIILIFIGLLGWGAWQLDKRHRGTSVPEFFSSMYMIFVFSFFWINNGWQGNIRAWFHLLFIISFGFIYIKSKQDNRIVPYILIPTLLIIDFFGIGFLWSSDILILKFIPLIVLFVIAYCYEKEAKSGQKNYTYPVAAFILLVTFFLIMTLKVSGVEEGSLPFVAQKGTTFSELYTQFTNNIKGAIEGRLDIATAGLYRGSVENNRYESLGVYFSKIRAADPRFYTDEPITVWGSIRSKTYKDAVIVNFSCYRFKDNKRIRADRIIPDIKFPIFTLEEVDAECTFLPTTEPKMQSGSNTITFSAEYNFGTDAYLKTYFMDRERFRANARENIDQLAQFGIKDKKPSSVSTNGPVEIGIGAGPLVPVSEGYAVKPVIGITLTNRQEIKDKDKRIITKWDGRIKNITALVLLTPPGILLPNIENCKLPKEDPNSLLCPCSMPFNEYKKVDCEHSCSDVKNPCVETCITVSKDDKERQSCVDECTSAELRCSDECERLFQSEDGSNSKYNAYSLDVGSLEFKDINKDIDKHRSFVCRYEPSPAVLDTTPITTRYFRARARYNYVVENSVSVNVEQAPVEAINVVPENLFKTSANIQSDSPLWFQGYSPQLINAIASIESRFKHCCREPQSRDGRKISAICTPSGQKECSFDNLITSGSSFGIMQINYQDKYKPLVDTLAQKYCQGKSIDDYDCNVKVGMAILKDKYDRFNKGCSGISGISTACNECKSNIAPFRKYSDYKGVEAALRGYNGWGCGTNADKGYVEKVLKAMTAINGVQIIDSTTLGGIQRQGEGMAEEP